LIKYHSFISKITLYTPLQFHLPSIPIIKQPLFVELQFFSLWEAYFRCGCLNYGINRACLNTVSAQYTPMHVNIIQYSPSLSVNSGFSLDVDGTGHACCLAQFARDATFVAALVPAQCMLTPENGPVRDPLPGLAHLRDGPQPPPHDFAYEVCVVG